MTTWNAAERSAGDTLLQDPDGKREFELTRDGWVERQIDGASVEAKPVAARDVVATVGASWSDWVRTATLRHLLAASEDLRRAVVQAIQAEIQLEHVSEAAARCRAAWQSVEGLAQPDAKAPQGPQ